jgi:hypothetical protein
VSDTELTDRMLDVIAATGQSAQVGRTIHDLNLRVVSRRLAPDRTDRDAARQELERAAREYEAIRESMAPGRARTRAMEEIATTVRLVVRDAELTPEEIRTRLRSQQAGDRVVGLTAVQAIGDRQAFPDVLEVVESPQSPFEQFQALRAIEALRGTLTAEDRSELRRVLTGWPWRDGLEGDSSRIRLADRILENVAMEPDTAALP